MKDKYKDCPTAPLSESDRLVGKYFFAATVLLYLAWLLWGK